MIKFFTDYLLVVVVLAYYLSACSGSQEPTETESSPPNILLIFTDQQHTNAMSAVGNPHLRTPAMEELASEGVLFTQAYCTSPVCAPARSSIITGLMPHETGVEWNGQSIKSSIPNIGQLLRKEGYRTVWGGKWHLPESYPQRTKAKNKTVDGFELLPFWNPDQERWMLGAETDPPLTKAVVDYLDNYDQSQPLFMAVSYHNPHDICFYARKNGWVTAEDSLLEIRFYGFKHKLPEVVGRHYNEFDNLPPLPTNFTVGENEPSFVQDKRKYHNEYGVETMLANQEFDEATWQGYLNAYYRLTEMVDAEIRQVIGALKDNGMWENTLIVFTSDHGDGAAAHQWAAKLSLYEESAKIPMIVAYPGRTPTRIDSTHLVSQIDIVPTMLDYAGIEAEASFTGQSMKTIIDSPSADWRNFVVTELADFKPDPSRKGRMMRTPVYKYNLYSNGEEQLYRLSHDPGEMVNLSASTDLEAEIKQHRQLLREWASSTQDTFALTQLKRY
ncbi:MAG: sulfatase [Cyclobacteriaceae bacterium]